MVETEIKLKLGDIIQIKSPTNAKYNLKYYLIEYINEETIKLIDIDKGDREMLELNESKFIDTTIAEIVLLSRTKEEGYAKQHKLLPNTDIKLDLNEGGGVVLGKITNLEEDMIEVKTTDDKTIYIDFGYKGAPDAFKEISVIDDLTVQKSVELKAENEKEKEEEKEEEKDDEEEKEEDTKSKDASMKFTEDGLVIITMPDNPAIDDNQVINLSEFIEELPEDTTTITADPIQDMLDKMLQNKTQSVNRLISRFKELRTKFSTFDKNGNIVGFRDFNETYKPLAERLDNLETSVQWIFPVVTRDKSTALKHADVKVDLEAVTEADHEFTRFAKGDSIAIQSVLIMPKPFIEFSRVNLPSTGILTKSELSHQWMFKIKGLNDDTIITRHRLENINEDFKYENGAFQKGVTTFDISPTLKADYKSLLQAVIPIGTDENYVGYNLQRMIACYEPFFIYMDTVTCDSPFYKELRKQIQENIKTYVNEYKQGKRDMLLADVSSLELVNSIVFENIKPELLKRLKAEYKFLKEDSQAKDALYMTSSEQLAKIRSIDGGRFYMSVMSYLTAYLYTPELASIVKVDDEPFMNSSKSCAKRIIAKKYTSIDALQKDNGRAEVYFDKEYDETPYDVLKKHAEAQKNMPNDEFLDYLTLVFKNEYKMKDDELAQATAKTVIMKKKPVEDGNYAKLVIYPKLKSTFDESELTNDEKKSVEIEADVKKRVSYFVRKNDNWVRDTTVSDEDVDFFEKDNEFCEIIESASDRMKKIAKKSLYETTIIDMNMQDFEEDLAKIFQTNEKKISKIYKLQKYKKELYSVRAYKIGAKLVEKEIVSSPYEKLRDTILICEDLDMRRHYILKFKQLYCREAVINGVLEESIHWYYCKKTNAKLLPTFEYKLAQSFEQNIDEVVASRGVRCDGWIVDKYSGYKIAQELLLTTTPSLSASRQNLTRTSSFKIPTRGTDQYTIFVVTKALCDKLNVQFYPLCEKIIAHTLRLVMDNVTDIKYHANKLNHKTPIQVWKMRNIILFTAAVTFVYLQTNITMDIYPENECKFSLEGFPLEESDNQSGLKFMSCLLNELKSNFGEPWVNIRKHSVERFLKELLVVVKKHLLPSMKIQKMLENKRIVANIVSTYVEKKSWQLFQPPREKIVAASGGAVPPVLKSEILESITSANKAQHKYLGILYKKIIENSYLYIQDKSENNLDFVKEYGQIYKEIKQLAVPPFLNSSARSLEIVSSSEISENNIYSAYIHYCNLKRDKPIPDDLQTICQEKLMGIDTMNLEQSINALEDNGKKQTAITLAQLMSIVANRNIVHLYEDEQPLSFVDIEPSNNQDLIISHILNALLNKDKVDELENYMKLLNKKMLENVKEYLNLYGRDISKSMKTKLSTHLEKINETKGHEIFIKNSIYKIMSTKPADENVSTLFEDIRNDPIIKDIVFLTSQLPTITDLSCSNLYKYCYLSMFSQIVSESKDDKYARYKVEDLFDGNEVDIIDDRYDFYSAVCSTIRTILEKDIQEVEFMNQTPYIRQPYDKSFDTSFESDIVETDDSDIIDYDDKWLDQ
jgi:hypothetical protein